MIVLPGIGGISVVAQIDARPMQLKPRGTAPLFSRYLLGLGET